MKLEPDFEGEEPLWVAYRDLLHYYAFSSLLRRFLGLPSSAIRFPAVYSTCAHACVCVLGGAIHCLLNYFRLKMLRFFFALNKLCLNLLLHFCLPGPSFPSFHLQTSLMQIAKTTNAKTTFTEGLRTAEDNYSSRQGRPLESFHGKVDHRGHYLL